ncbi:hypothetical protein AMTRI_Chr13g92820 [Amborella trichopoda]
MKLRGEPYTFLNMISIQSHHHQLAFLAALLSATAWCFYKSTTLRTQRRESTNLLHSSHLDHYKKPKNQQLKCSSSSSCNCSTSREQPDNSCCRSAKIFFASETGTSEGLARRLLQTLNASSKQLMCSFELVDPSRYEPEDLPKENLVVIVASTWEDGKPPRNSQFLAQWLHESSNDFRVGSTLLTSCKFAVYGVGSSSYGPKTFNKVARVFSHQMEALGAIEILPLCKGDVDTGDLDQSFNHWCIQIIDRLSGLGDRLSSSNLRSIEVASSSKGEDEEEKASDGIEEDSDDDKENNASDGFEEDSDDDKENNDGESVVDLEDIAGKGPSREPPQNGKVGRRRKSFGKTQADVKPLSSMNRVENGERREMVTPVIRANLEKQGYKIIGSHSGVKICRWTKSQLRGRGGCYKHSFYGIESHRCMEATPSLACANKCVFCWRHHTNPVGKSWQWKLDDPLEIVNAAIDEHTKMIKQMKGVPGVTTERLFEGLSPRHCALSLVGEPIMYPEINALIDELHKRRISTFLVTNAQFPERIRILKPVTQLYVSVDAATKESLKAIDRPLFGDFWERFTDSLRALREKEQRTVYRLTLVKGWNAEEIDSYYELFSVGKPDFVEIKGVTYCGSSATSKLTMENVPWHSDVKAFSEALASKSGSEYEIACEHAHSCCVLLARADKFKVNGQWFTWIDYERFHDLVASGVPFGGKDYMAATPSWAVYGAEEGGFDPDQARYKKERRHGSCNGQNRQPIS